MERSVPFEPDEIYHVYNRGVDKRSIFLDTKDWMRFQLLLRICNTTRPVKLDRLEADPYSRAPDDRITHIIAYALMPNHFHIILKERGQRGASKFMGKLMTSYSMYFNKKYERSGPLMCRPFRSRHIDSDEYFRWAFSYVHLNHEQATFARNYSSYPDYFLTNREESSILSPESSPVPVNELRNMDSLHELLSTCKTEGAFDYSEKFINS